MNAKVPPVPAESRSPKGAGDDKRTDVGSGGSTAPVDNTAKQGQQGNAHVNTTHQGHQQDR